MAEFQADTIKVNQTGNPIAGGPGIWRVRIRNSGPVAVRVGANDVTFQPPSGFLLAPDDPWLEIETDDVVYAIAPPNAAGIGQGQVDYLTETR